MNYKLYQIQLTEAEYNKINAEGHNSVPKHRLKLDMSFFIDAWILEDVKYVDRYDWSVLVTTEDELIRIHKYAS